MGRWLTTDPAGQYASPYLGMGNNPISMMDPDGGYSKDWYKNAQGDIVWHDNTASSFENGQGKWENVGATLNDVADYLGLYSSIFSFKNMDYTIFSGKGRRGVIGIPVPIVLKTTGLTDVGFSLSNSGEYGLDRIDGKTSITGINLNTSLAVTIFAPGISIKSITGYTSAYTKTSPLTGKSPMFTASLRTTNIDVIYPEGASVVTGSSSLIIPLRKYYHLSHAYQSKGVPRPSISGVLDITLGQNGSSKKLGINSNSFF
ncbi:MAG: hypothetical protein HRT66_12635 [Flavobacteriaceae bacterium]|nr:hypothetical protein [Flavobacteriaceae bacterium]